MSILSDIEKIIAEAEVTPDDVTNAENVGDAPVETDDTIEITLGDLKEEVYSKVKELIMKEMNATDEFSEKNVESKLQVYSVFRGSVKEFINTLGIENK